MLNWEDDTPVAPAKVVPTPIPELKATLATPRVVDTPVPNEAIAPIQASPEVAKDRRVNVADKRIINGQTDVNQLVPFNIILTYLAGMLILFNS